MEPRQGLSDGFSVADLLWSAKCPYVPLHLKGIWQVWLNSDSGKDLEAKHVGGQNAPGYAGILHIP